jgi:hypothetical protein
MSTPALDLSAARLAVTWQAPGTHQVFALFDDGAWFWTLASPADPWSALAGAFRCDAGDGERAALLDLGARVAAGAVPDSGGTGGLALVLAAGGRTVRVDAGGEAAGEVTRATLPLLAVGRRRPVSAIEVRAARMAPPGAPSVLGLAFTAIGVEPTQLRLDAESVRLIGADGPWQQVPAPRMGLVEGAGNLLDGLYAPAVIPAGTTGAWVLAGADAQPGQRVRAGGTVRASGPWAESNAPLLAFEVSAPVDLPR